MWLSVLIFSFLTGFIVTQMVNWLDFALDFGHYFWKFRFRRAAKAAKEQGLKRWLLRELNGSMMLPLNEGIERMDRAYWHLSRKDKGLMLWICEYCFGSRIIGAVSLFFAICVGAIEGVELGVLYFFTTNAAFWYFMNR